MNGNGWSLGGFAYRIYWRGFVDGLFNFRGGWRFLRWALRVALGRRDRRLSWGHLFYVQFFKFARIVVPLRGCSTGGTSRRPNRLHLAAVVPEGYARTQTQKIFFFFFFFFFLLQSHACDFNTTTHPPTPPPSYFSRSNRYPRNCPRQSLPGSPSARHHPAGVQPANPVAPQYRRHCFTFSPL